MYRAHARATPFLQRISRLIRKISGGIIGGCGLLFKTTATKQNTCATNLQITTRRRARARKERERGRDREREIGRHNE